MLSLQEKKRDLALLLQPGDSVEFIVAASSHDGARNTKGGRPTKLIGKQVTTLFSSCPSWSHLSAECVTAGRKTITPNGTEAMQCVCWSSMFGWSPHQASSQST
jgi:hypothetical protein